MANIIEKPKKILITGASSGIGEALALAYASSGAMLCLTGRNQTRLEAVAAHCIEKGSTVVSAALDVTDRQAMSDWIATQQEEVSFDLVIANAGISAGTGGHEEGESIQQAREIFDINLYGILNTIEPVLSDMIERKRGQIAVLSSLVGYRGWPTAPAYSASKGAVRFYGEALRGALKDTGVKVSVICPGFVTSRITDQNDFAMPLKMEAEKAAQIIKRGLEKNKGRIAFPWPVVFISWFISILPDCLAQKILTLFPAKKAL
ncbi:MAG: SDR family NAD(P)-dependent oxidoreductase [Pseudomonadota bacterium]